MAVNGKCKADYKSEFLREHEELIKAEKIIETLVDKLGTCEKKVAFLEGQVRAYEFVITKGDIDAIVSFTNPFINNEEEVQK